jgi:hypothetical protein
MYTIAFVMMKSLLCSMTRLWAMSFDNGLGHG